MDDERGATGRAEVIRPAGRLDLAEAPRFGQQVKRFIDAGSAKLVLDLSEVTFLDSSGLMAIIAALKQARQAGGDLRLADLSRQAETVIELSSLTQVLPIYPSVEKALEDFD